MEIGRSMEISRNALDMPTSEIRAMAVRAREYKNVVSFGLGEPDFATPQHIIDAGCRALNSGYTKYVANEGIVPLRRAIAEKARKENGIGWAREENVHITFGAGQALLLSMTTLLDPGDEIIIPAPFYPNYLGCAHLAGGRWKIVNTCEENRFCVQAEEIEAAVTPATKALILNSPCNPTGSVLEEAELRKIAEVAKKHHISIISDEPYESIIYDGRKNSSIAALEGVENIVVTVNSFSKTYAMTGWRVGYIIAPADVCRRMALLQESMGSSVTAACQMAACAAISGPQDSVEEMRRQYQRRRDLLVDGLNSIPGFSCAAPSGAFYAFPNVKKLGMTSQTLAEKILAEVQVLTTPGSAFGEAGEGYLRFSFASSEETIMEGLRRLRRMFG